MRMILTEHFTHDTSGFLISRIRADAHVVHGVENASLYGLEPITCVRQGARKLSVELVETSLAAIEPLGAAAKPLRDLAVIVRDRVR